MSKLADKTRDEMVEFLTSELIAVSFGDGMEDDYIKHGFQFKGLYNMTDQELYDQMLNFTGETEPIMVEAKRQLSIKLV